MRNAAIACATKMTALKKTRDNVTTSVIVSLTFARPPDGMVCPGTKFRIGAVVVNIVLMDIVPMDSARRQGPDVPVPGEGAVFDASLRRSLAEWDLGLVICKMILERHNGQISIAQVHLKAWRST